MNEGDHRAAFRPAQGEIPTTPGVYRFSDRHGRVLYIGKAKNLRARLANYFQPMHALMPRTQRMLTLAAQLDWTVVATDTESLVLEHTWITEYKPPFNVQFKDDKTYPYLAVTLREDAPRLIITRNEKIRGARYFGPYPKVWALRETTNLLQQAFPIRTCNDADYKRAMDSGRPCLAGQIGRCNGPCSGKISLEAHRERVDELVAFLAGGDTSHLKQLQHAMRDAAAEQRYEDAARLRDQVQAVEHVLEKNAIVLGLDVELDVFGLKSDELSAAAHQFIIRGGRIRGERSWIVDVELDDSPGTLLEQVIQSAYDDGHEAPAKILVSTMPADLPALEEALRANRPRRGKVRIQVPERGDKAQLMNRALLNAGENLLRHKLKRAADITARTDALAELQEGLDMGEAPLRIECIDVSHLQGTGVVASLVVFEDGLPAKGAYRKYRIEQTTDDTDSIYQVVSRRAAQLNAAVEAGEPPSGRYRDRPQLLIVDGGQPQVAAAQRALREAGITDVALCGVAKRLEELWLPDDPFPVILPRTSESLFLVQRIRDEAHRFAITFQRQRRSTAISSQLSEIPGLGPKRVQALLKHFGSVARLRAASPEEIASAPGVGDQLAEQIHRHVHAPAAGKLVGGESAETSEEDGE
ncbi:excinuclease ABC subunit C [Leucobacter sp. OLJS4]|uniref:excinuclease ABC subunit UvrC n=1 Tax=unclassified Leucobacter TaxID=2621730 RepID=UPI000C19CDCC|nr:MULTISPECIES: excinuclease ABC subunit UvrC [unclassified Leucobacter]PII86185.1 excinuclease ABC subunit C [Leucobacter sp. OLTLW20]PII90080.1 excinuclease ABC subunit C [Leucobacter sp. OLAS13]PII97113.1 excinuclease ABC subunit C [Leucobacter sp. OLDS2]PIJ02193.1 excinuclease ABC subunit C [Leucobacter sp. OLIS6]PIJ03050.1 excinuclease ABC subunit C [Leucobacter sp. OLCS4]